MSGENGPPVSMDVLTNGVPNQGERDNRESETLSTLKVEIACFESWREGW